MPDEQNAQVSSSVRRVEHIFSYSLSIFTHILTDEWVSFFVLALFHFYCTTRKRLLEKKNGLRIDRDIQKDILGKNEKKVNHFLLLLLSIFFSVSPGIFDAYISPDSTCVTQHLLSHRQSTHVCSPISICSRHWCTDCNNDHHIDEKIERKKMNIFTTFEKSQ